MRSRLTWALLAIMLGTIAFLFRPIDSTARVESIGLVGDGSTDNTAIIRQLLKKHGGVDFPRGRFVIKETIVVDLDSTGPIALTGQGHSTIVMTGPGPAFKFIGTHGGTASPKTVQPNIWKNQRTPMITGIEIVGEHPEADAIEAEGTMQLTIDAVVIRECRHGVHLVKRNRNVLISACHIYNNRGIGVYLDHVNLHQTNIVGSHISYCKQGGVVSVGGEVRNVHISGCDIEGNMAATEKPTANVLLDSTGGSIAEVAITGCTIQHESPSPDSANIRILGKGVGGLKNVPGETREGHVTITGNVFSDVQVNVDIRDARGVSIVGNTFWMGYQHNLRVERSSHIVVGPNDFQRNPRYDYGTAATTKNAISFRDCEDCSLNGMHVHLVRGAAAGVDLERCQRFNISNLTILDCEAIGLRLQDVTQSRVSGCLIRNDLPGVKTWQPIIANGCSGTTIEGNSLGEKR